MYDPSQSHPGDPQPTSAYQQGYYSPPPPPRRRRRGPLIISLIVLAAVGIGSFAIVTNRQYLVDQWTVWNYEPTSTVQGYIDRSMMNDHGEFLFLASEPVVADGEQFNSVCGNEEEGSGVLGCYTSGNKRITLFDVTDPQLDGIEEVVAAHEMLHAAWDRTGTERRAELEALLEAEYATLSADPAYAARMEIYARTEPGQRVNELHSIIGTEVAELSPELTEYYDQFFTDRATLVALHVKSNAVFVQIEAQSAALVAELDALRISIEADTTAANADQDTLNGDIEVFNTKADNGGFTSQSEFDDDRAALLARQSALDARYDDIQSRITTFDAKSAELEALNAQAAALNTALNIVPRPTEEGEEIE